MAQALLYRAFSESKQADFLFLGEKVLVRVLFSWSLGCCGWFRHRLDTEKIRSALHQVKALAQD